MKKKVLVEEKKAISVEDLFINYRGSTHTPPNYLGCAEAGLYFGMDDFWNLLSTSSGEDEALSLFFEDMLFNKDKKKLAKRVCKFSNIAAGYKKGDFEFFFYDASDVGSSCRLFFWKIGTIPTNTYVTIK